MNGFPLLTTALLLPIVGAVVVAVLPKGGRAALPKQVALAFSPLATLSFLTSLAAFSLLSLCAYAAAVWLLWRHAPGLRTDARYVALVAAGSLTVGLLAGPAAADPAFPSAREVERSQSAVASTAASVGQIEARLAAASAEWQNGMK